MKEYSIEIDNKNYKIIIDDKQIKIYLELKTSNLTESRYIEFNQDTKDYLYRKQKHKIYGHMVYNKSYSKNGISFKNLEVPIDEAFEEIKSIIFDLKQENIINANLLGKYILGDIYQKLLEIKNLPKNVNLDYNILAEKERFEIINLNRSPIEVLHYLIEKLSNIDVDIAGMYQGKIVDLMKNGKLEGWCWQTTETAILFLEDEDFIERGYLKFDNEHNYYHSWICFTYKTKEYVFDSCLNLLCDKDLYYKVFQIVVKGKVTSKEVKEYFIKYIINSSEKEQVRDEIEFKEEIVVHDEEDSNAPMYRNGVGYRGKFENGRVKKLKAHYYMYG